MGTTTLTQRLLQRTFAVPRGPLGRLGGLLMGYGNAATERHAVALAEPQPGETVLVLGPGPGVGVRAAAVSGHVVAVDPAALMLAACRRRCRPLLRAGTLRLRTVVGTAERTGLAAGSADVAVSVNTVSHWPDRAAGFAELRRVLRPGGRLVLSMHERWLPGGAAGLRADAAAAGFTGIDCTRWEPPTRAAGTAVLLHAVTPAQHSPQ